MQRTIKGRHGPYTNSCVQHIEFADSAGSVTGKYVRSVCFREPLLSRALFLLIETLSKTLLQALGK